MKIESRLFRTNRVAAILCAFSFCTLATLAQSNSIPNRFIDYNAFLTGAGEVARLRAEHRVTEERFIEMAAEPATVIFDARSDDKYARLHIKGARHLSFPDITADALAQVFPNKTTRILIYCNNNFLNAPNFFPTKASAAALNIHTFNTLYNYGYTNVYELGPLIDVQKAKLQFEGTSVLAKKARKTGSKLLRFRRTSPANSIGLRSATTRVALWATFHPSDATRECFVNQCRQLDVQQDTVAALVRNPSSGLRS